VGQVGSNAGRRSRWLRLAGAFVACAGAGVLIYFWWQARPLWVDEEMLGLNARDRSLRSLGGPLWLGQAAPLGWMALERGVMLTFGVSERAVRALPVLWGLLTLVATVWTARRWLGPVGAAVLAGLCSFGNHIWFFALELKQYSADTFGGLFLPALAAWAIDVPADGPSTSARRVDGWWLAAGVMQWFSYGALFVTPGCGIAIVACTWRRSGWRAAARAGALSVFWAACATAHYVVSIRYASHSKYLRDYWAAAFPPVSAGPAETTRWLAERLDALSNIPGGTAYSVSFWVIAVAGLALVVRRRPVFGLILATIPASAFLLAALRLVPLSGRLSLWMLPSLYIGIAMAAEVALNVTGDSARRRRWAGAGVGLIGSVLVARLCADVYFTGAFDIRNRPRSTHGLDDRGAVRFLMARRHPGDAMLATHLGLPAVWWFGGVNLSASADGASLADGGPIFEVWHAAPGPECSPGALAAALAGVHGATAYLGFELENHFEELLLNRLAELGAVTTYRRFAETGHAAVIDLRQSPTGRILLPGMRTTAALVRPEGCVTIKRAHRW
jgi:hypothetical protein